MEIPIVNVVCYSYKGGSGRSTAAVNIAFELARQGELVICIDMDVGAPGLHMILAEWHSKAAEKIHHNEGFVGHQDFLNRQNTSLTQDPLHRIRKAMLDPEDCDSAVLEPEERGPSIEKRGRLFFLFSSTKQRTLTDLRRGKNGQRDFIEKYNTLQKLLAKDIGGDQQRKVYVIVDAPNGITSESLPLLKNADLILMFYRHSLQHVEGTIDAGRKLHYYLLEEIERRFIRILLVGSCVPDRLIEHLLSVARDKGFTEGSYEENMVNKFQIIQNKLEVFQEDLPNEVVKLKEDIIEDDILKILEQPLTNQGISKRILGYDSDPEEKSSIRTRQKIRAIVEELRGFGEEVIFMNQLQGTH